jgi:hypothetical protein
MTLPSSSSMLLVLGVVSGSTMAFSWAPTVLLSLPCSCHMPSRRWLSSRWRRSCCSWSSTGSGPVGIGGGDDGLGELVQLCRGQDGCLVGEQLLSRLHGLRVEAGPG